MDNLTTRNVRFGRLTRLQRLFLLGACLCADRTIDHSAAAATLQELLDGASIVVGNARFSDWELDSLSSTAGNPNLGQITVVPLLNDLANPGLLFTANGQLAVSGANSIDLMFTYRVHALTAGNAFTNHALALTGVNFGGNGGLAFVTDDLRDDSGGDLDPTFVIDDKTSNFAQRHDLSAFAPQAALSVTSNVFISGLSATDMINLASFTQRFAQTGPVFAAGDFDEDGDVDAADLAKWKAGFGATGDAAHIQGDADGDRDVDGADLLIWQRELGATSPAIVAPTPIPEPASNSLFMAGFLAVILGRWTTELSSSRTRLPTGFGKVAVLIALVRMFGIRLLGGYNVTNRVKPYPNLCERLVAEAACDAPCRNENERIVVAGRWATGREGRRRLPAVPGFNDQRSRTNQLSARHPTDTLEPLLQMPWAGFGES